MRVGLKEGLHDATKEDGGRDTLLKAKVVR